MTWVQQWLLRRAQRHPSPILAAHHHELLAGVAGCVLEIGAGTGRLFTRYPATVTELLAVEPDPDLRRAAASSTADVPFPVQVLAGSAEQLPAPAASVDVVVCCEVSCSVTDPLRALTQARQVLRPGGKLRVYEHVVSASRTGRSLQRLTDRAGWPRLLGGCHAARNTATTITSAGFAWSQHRRVWQSSMPLTWPTGPHILGTATP